jgi:hypothetical protein
MTVTFRRYHVVEQTARRRSTQKPRAIIRIVPATHEQFNCHFSLNSLNCQLKLTVYKLKTDSSLLISENWLKYDFTYFFNWNDGTVCKLNMCGNYRQSCRSYLRIRTCISGSLWHSEKKSKEHYDWEIKLATYKNLLEKIKEAESKATIDTVESKINTIRCTKGEGGSGPFIEISTYSMI